MSLCQQLREKKLLELFKELKSNKKVISSAKNIEELSDLLKLKDKIEQNRKKANRLISLFLTQVYQEEGKRPLYNNKFLEIFKKVTGEEILYYSRKEGINPDGSIKTDIYIQQNDILAGRVEIEKNSEVRVVPFQGYKLFTTIEGKEIINADDIHTRPNGALAGRVVFREIDSQGNIITRNVPFIGNKLLKEINGKKIIRAFNIHTQPSGILAGIIYIEEDNSESTRCVIFQGNKFLTEIGGKEILDALDVHTQPNGTLAGIIYIERKDPDGKIRVKRVPFIGNKILEEIEGVKIHEVAWSHSLKDTNILYCWAYLENGDSVGFTWDGKKINIEN